MNSRHLLVVYLLITLVVGSDLAFAQGKQAEEVQYVLTKERTVHSSLKGSAIDIDSLIYLGFVSDIDTVFCGIKKVKRAWVEVRLHLEGESSQYRIGRRNYDGAVTFMVIGMTDNDPTWGFSSPNYVDLHVESDSTAFIRPEQMYVFDVTTHHPHHLPMGDTSKGLAISVQDIALTGIPTDLLDSLILTATLYEEHEVLPFQSDSTLCASGSMVKTNAVSTNDNRTTLSWLLHNGTIECPDLMPAFEVQVMRLLNTDEEYRGTSREGKFVINWDNPQRFYTYGPATSITITLAEGTGYYAWRVRPIGNLHRGNMANDSNNGCWSNYPSYDTTVTLSDTTGLAALNNQYGSGSKVFFYYEQFDSDKNWQFSRVFREDTDGKPGIAEGMTYATTLLLPVQKQLPRPSSGDVLLQQTIPDYYGRPMLSTLSAPKLRDGDAPAGLGYVPLVAVADSATGKPYTAADYDSATNYNDPEPMFGLVTNYYDDNPNQAIPSSEQYPYSRTRVSTDPLQRTVESSAAGPALRIGQHTVRTAFGNASEKELVSMFGTEAPNPLVIEKIINYDQNNVASVTYQRLDGKVIATCLPRQDPNPALLALNDTSNVNELELIDTVRHGSLIGERTIRESKVLTFADTIGIQLAYHLTPDIFEAGCVDYCSFCDYTVQLRLIEQTTGDLKFDTTLHIGPDACDAELEFNKPWSSVITLLKGSYILERTISPRSDDSPILSGHLSEIREAHISDTESFLSNLFTTLGHEDDLDSLRTDAHLLDESIARRMLTRYKNYRDSVIDSTSAPFVEFDSCCAIYLDTSTCVTGCEGNIFSYEDELIKMWKDTVNVLLDSGDGEDIRTYITYFDGEQILEDWDPDFPDGVGVIDSLLRLMIDSAGYDCGRVWDCWLGVCQGYLARGWYRVNDSTLSRVPGYNLLSDFLACVGTQYCETADYADKITGSAWLLNAWKILPINPDIEVHAACSEAMMMPVDGWECNGTNNDTVNSHYVDLENCYRGKAMASAESEYAGTMLDLLEEANDSVSTSRFEACSTRACVEQKFQEMEDSCTTLCDSRREEFRDSIVALYMRSEWFVESFSPDTLVRSDTLEKHQLACLTALMIEQCKSQCDLPVAWTMVERESEMVDSLISPTAEDMERFKWPYMNSRFTIAMPQADTCPNSTYEHVTRSIVLAEYVVEILNQELKDYKDSLREKYGAGLSRFDLTPHLRKLAEEFEGLGECIPELSDGYNPTDTVNLEAAPSSPLSVIVDLTKPSRFYVDKSLGECQIAYDPPESDEFDNPYTTENPHPLVGMLNKHLKSTWGKVVSDTVLDLMYEIDTTTSEFIDSVDYWTMYSTKRQRSDIDVFYTDSLKPAFACDDDGLDLIGQEVWELCNISVGCIGGSQTTLQALGELLGVQTNYDVLIRKHPEDTVLHAYGGQAFNLCGCLIRCVVGFNQADSTISVTLFICNDVGSLFSVNLDADQSEWDELPPGLGFLNRVGKFVQTENGNLGFQNLIDPNKPITEFPCINFACRPAREDTCMVVPICNICDTVECGQICFKWNEPVTPQPTIVLKAKSCAQTEVERLLLRLEGELQGDCLKRKLKEVEISYDTSCFNPMLINDRFMLKRTEGFYHYTLYYYDRAGNLVRTIPPDGFVAMASPNREDSSEHTLRTEYVYNTLGQLKQQISPDAGRTRFWYDALGRIRLSQNARQSSTTYSYTNYDTLGRVIEVGEKSGVSADPQDYLAANPNIAGTDRTLTTYSTAITVGTPWNRPQRNTLNRVSKTRTDVDGNLASLKDQAETWYSYDPHGNVEWVANKLRSDFLPVQPLVMIDYEYDLMSGRVQKVTLQPGRKDQFIQRYTYDHDGRVTSVRTSRDGHIWERDAAYDYNVHGPLARMEIGRDSLQGVDYAYTINGWLKSINNPALDADVDAGEDGLVSGVHEYTGVDVFGMSLGYHTNDFIHDGSVYDSSDAGGLQTFGGKYGLYNGNISWWTSNTLTGGGADIGTVAMTYRYDLLNRLRSDTSRYWLVDDYDDPSLALNTNYTYDGNGNIQTLTRRDGIETLFDSLDYTYASGTNKLTHIDDEMGSGVSGVDLDDQAVNNYDYDAIGNMTKDTSAGINPGGIVWSASGKIRSIIMMGKSPTQKLEYLYDAMGNRVVKHFYEPYDELVLSTFYVRDAQGNVLAIYEKEPDNSPVNLKENHIYGSSRVGVSRVSGVVLSPVNVDTMIENDTVYSRDIALREYELTDHLGNVRATVTDLLQPNSGTYYAALTTTTDYFPFGMRNVDRSWSADEMYRYGFNGQESDEEVKDGHRFLTAEFWEYDVLTGRRWNLDPKPVVGLSEYSAFGLNPILNLDPLGDSLSGTSDISAKRLLNAIQSGLQGEEARKVRRLFKLDGSTFRSIDMDKFEEAAKKLSPEQYGLALGYALLVNDENQHWVTIVRSGGSLSQKALELAEEANWGLTSGSPPQGMSPSETELYLEFVSDKSAFSKNFKNGDSWAFIPFDNSNNVNSDYQATSSGVELTKRASIGELSAHENLGHILSIALGLKKIHSMSALQVTNMYLRATGVKSYFRINTHGGSKGLERKVQEIPTYLQKKK